MVLNLLFICVCYYVYFIFKYRLRKNGIIGYRFFGNELYIYENEYLRIEMERRLEIENCIKNNFKGEVYFRLLNKVLKL